jgi:hypothetical protein
MCRVAHDGLSGGYAAERVSSTVGTGSEPMLNIVVKKLEQDAKTKGASKETAAPHVR